MFFYKEQDLKSASNQNLLSIRMFIYKKQYLRISFKTKISYLYACFFIRNNI